MLIEILSQKKTCLLKYGYFVPQSSNHMLKCRKLGQDFVQNICSICIYKEYTAVNRRLLNFCHVRLAYKPYFFSQRTIFFSYNKSVNSTFSHSLSIKQRRQLLHPNTCLAREIYYLVIEVQCMFDAVRT